MSKTTFSGPVAATNSFILPTTVTASLPTASVANTGLLYVVTDNGVGNNETAVVLCNGTGWTLTTGAALT